MVRRDHRLDGATRTHDAHAAEPSVLLQVPRTELLTWLRKHPQHWRALAVLMAEGYGVQTSHGGTRCVLAVTPRKLAID